MLALIIIAFNVSLLTTTESSDIDLHLKNGTIIDGAGAEPYAGSVAIAGDKIVAVGNVEQKSAAKPIDCTGLVIAPGFIDLHNHSDDSILKKENQSALCYL